MLPVVIITYNRYKLLRQTLFSLLHNSTTEIVPIVIDNTSTDEYVRRYLQEEMKGKIIYFRYPSPVKLAIAKNKGEELAPASKYIHFGDNDVYFMPNWDRTMLDVMENNSHIGVLGGQKHPHHPRLSEEKYNGINIIYSTDQAGYSMMLRRDEFKKFGPFIYTQNGDSKFYGMEDCGMCNSLKFVGKKIAAVEPSVLIHCGIVKADNTLTAGSDIMKQWQRDYPNIYFN